VTFWIGVAAAYPMLPALAHHVLAIPGSSIPCEAVQHSWPSGQQPMHQALTGERC